MSQPTEHGSRSRIVRQSARAHLLALRQARAQRAKSASPSDVASGDALTPERVDDGTAAIIPGRESGVAATAATEAANPVSEDDLAPEAGSGAEADLVEDAGALALASDATEEASAESQDAPQDLTAGGASEDEAAASLSGADGTAEASESDAGEIDTAAAAIEGAEAAPESVMDEAGAETEATLDAVGEVAADNAQGSGPATGSSERPDAAAADLQAEAPDMEADAPVDAPVYAEPAMPDPEGAAELQSLPGIGPGLIWMLQKAGISTLADLAEADVEALARELGAVSALLDVGYWVDCARATVRAKSDG